MPTYVFKCADCYAEEEIVVSVSEFEELRNGKLCKNSPDLCQGIASPVIQPTSFALHGSGWAKDGYGGKR